MNGNIATFSPGKVWISDLADNQVVFSEGCTIEEFITPLSDKAESDVAINLNSIGNAEFACENTQINMPLFNSMFETLETPRRIYWDVPILIQARWHKKHRINKKWLKRYGMKRDMIAAEATIRSFTCTPRCAIPTDIVYYNSDMYNFEFDISEVIFKYKPSQTYRNRKIEYLR